MQFHFNFPNFSYQEPKKRAKEPSFYKNDKIFENIKKENTIKHIYRYKTLYKLFAYLYFLTIEKPLSCLIYYQDDGDFYAEIKETWQLEIKDRVLQHINLIRQIRNGVIFDTAEPTFVFDNEFESGLLFQQSQI